MTSHLGPVRQFRIHEAACFDADRLQSRARAMGFTQATEVEAFAWALELCGQLQSAMAEGLLLKGGTAVQLYLPVEQQRASVDIDLLALGDPAALNVALDQVSRKLASGPYFTFEAYSPKQPQAGLPLQTFFVTVPSAFGMTTPGAAGPIAGRAIKVDIFYLRASLSSVVVERPRTFALDLAYSPRCMAPGPLLGDKLLTLATRSIGVPRVRADDLPKHLYDLDNLSRLTLTREDFEALLATVPVLIEVESAFRGLSVNVLQVLEHIEETLLRLAALDLREGDADLKRYVLNMQSQYLRAPRRAPFYGWAAKAQRLRFLVRGLAALIQGRALDLAALLRRADALEAHLAFDGLSGDERRLKRRAAQELLIAELREASRGEWKQLKPRPPERIYWELVNLENLSQLEDRVSRF